MIKLRDSETKEIIAEFKTVEEAIEYADEHDLACYIDCKDWMPELKN